MERGICPTAMLYVAFDVLSVTLRPLLVIKGTNFTTGTALYCHHFGSIGSRDVIGHVAIRSAVGGFL